MAKQARHPPRGQAPTAPPDLLTAAPKKKRQLAQSEVAPEHGFIFMDDIKQRRAQLALMDAEPTQKDMAGEESIIANEGSAKKSKDKRAAPSPGGDLLASYMQQLSKLSLFTPQQEQENARLLEEAELHMWRIVLESPRASEIFAKQIEAYNEDSDAHLRSCLDELCTSYRKASARSHKKHLAAAPVRQQAIMELSKAVRLRDFDKELLEGLMAALRLEVWSRRVLAGSAAFRLTHADMTQLECARGKALRLRNAFVRANLRLVISVARNFHHYRIPFIDLIQEGNVGLLKAVHRFDYSRGFRFSTYAHWWIRQSIERAIINKGSQVRLPVHVIDARRQITRATQKMTHDLGRGPTIDELAKELELPVEKVDQTLCGIQQDPLSLDEQIGESGQRKFLDLMQDKTIPAIDESLIRENSHARVRELLHLLNPIERDIIRRRFGMGTDSDQTLDDIGRLYNLSRERVRQIQAQGLSKMRRMCERRGIS